MLSGKIALNVESVSILDRKKVYNQAKYLTVYHVLLVII